MSEAKIYYSQKELFKETPRGLWLKGEHYYIPKHDVQRLKKIIRDITGVEVDKVKVTGDVQLPMWEGEVFVKSEKGVFKVDVTESMDREYFILYISKLWIPKRKESRVVSARIPEELFRELKEFAEKRGIKIGDIIQEALESYNKMLKAEYATEVDNAYAKYVFRVIDLVNALLEEISTPTARLKVFARITERARFDTTSVPEEHLTIDLGDYYIFIWTEILSKA